MTIKSWYTENTELERSIGEWVVGILYWRSIFIVIVSIFSRNFKRDLYTVTDTQAKVVLKENLTEAVVLYFTKDLWIIIDFSMELHIESLIDLTPHEDLIRRTFIGWVHAGSLTVS